jgi:hypothetical protein
MTEVGNDTRGGSWLERELERQLCPVSAPDSLWRRIHEQRRSLRVRQRQGAAWLAAAVALALVSATVAKQVVMKRHPAPDLQTLSKREVRALAEGSGTLDFRSNDPVAIRAWVMNRSGLDIKLPERQIEGSEVRLFGARLIYVEGLPITAITYRVGKDLVAMLVTGKGGPFHETKKLEHAAPRVTVTGDMRFVSWNMGGELYTIALAGMTGPQRECLLCHTESLGSLGQM